MPISQAKAELSLVLEHVGLSFKDFLLGKEIYSDDLSKINSFIERRVSNREPIQQILGYGYFMGEKFIVSQDTLIPRPETEILVEEVSKLSGDKILDIGTGTGCIAIMLQKINKKTVFACDISQKALEIAKLNAKKLNADVVFFHSDLFEKNTQQFDIIVSNPPYIPFCTDLSEEVLKEPHSALFANDNGLYFYKKIINEAPKYLFSGGFLAFEIGYNQAEQIKNILEENNFSNIKIIKDLSKKDRVVIAKKQ